MSFHRKVSSGYTIVEVLIVLAISTVIAVAAIGLFNSQTGTAAFNDSVHDVSGEIEKELADVGSSQLLNENKYSCSFDSGDGRVRVSDTPSTYGNEDCLVLGTAVLAFPGTDTLYYYTVLGSSQVHDGSSSGIAIGPITNLTDARPTVSIGATPSPRPSCTPRPPRFTCPPAPPGPRPAGPALIDDYQFSNDLKIIYSKTDTVATSNIVGFYLQFNAQGDVSGNGSQATALSAYDAYTNGHNNPSVKSCIEKTSTTCSDPIPASIWTLCLGSADGDRQAAIRVNVNNSSTKTEVLDTCP